MTGPRRAFIAGAVALAAAPRAARGQQATRVYRLGLLGGSPPTAHEASARLWEAFFDGLRELGYVEGRNFRVEGRWYGEQPERLPALAAELVRLEVDVIVAGATPAPEAAHRATATIPIVMASHADPVGSGLVVSLARPGKNVTGLSTLSSELVGKQLQLLKEVVPGISRVGLLRNPTVPVQTLSVREAEAAARSLKLQVQVVEARAPTDLAGAFSRMTREGVEGLLALSGSVFFAERARIAELAAQSRLPAVYIVREFVEAGGLLGYGASIRENWRRAASYVDRILKGARPAEMPVEQPTKFELVVNLKAARALGLTLPPALLARADEVIER